MAAWRGNTNDRELPNWVIALLVAFEIAIGLVVLHYS
jgi:hypothetical protein